MRNKNHLRIAVCECDTVWENAEATISALDAPVRAFCAARKPDLLIFPETFSVGFSMNPEVSEQPDGFSATWLRRLSAETGVAVIGSIPILEKAADGTPRRFNRCHFVTPDGTERHYDKRHLFNISGEGAAYTPGSERCTVPFKGWNIELNVCYDLRFPAWSRNDDLRYDLLVNIANWPAPRIPQADVLIRARAIENSCYALFCNRVGEDTTCIYNGHSAVFNFFGQKISRRSTFEGVNFLTAHLSKNALEHYRTKFPAWKDADKIEILTK